MIADKVRVNEKISAKEVRLIGPDGKQIGIVPLERALRIAEEHELDLVEVAPNADPPVCKIMDYGKYRYQQEQKEKEARRKQSQIVIKEVKLRPKIDDHDLEVKRNHIKRFLKEGFRVKLTVMFKGREMLHTHLGRKLLERVVEGFDGEYVFESEPKLDGRNMVVMLLPTARREK